MDGGLTALGGFLYQTVVALSLKADTFQEYDDAPINNSDLETVLGFAKDGEVRYEDEDQDVSIRHTLHGERSGYVLVQLKYSSLSPRPPITKHGLEKIIKRLQASETSALARGHQVIGYSLLTNRPLNDDAQQVAQTYRLPFYITSSLPVLYWEERLRQFARCFSCIDPEIEAGIRQGIGGLLLKATNPHFYGEPVITREMVIELFTRCQEAHAVTPEIVAKKSQQRLNKLFTETFHFDWQPLVVRQNIQKQLSELVEQHAFVVLSGVGGNGKTAALWQWLDDSFRSGLPQQQGRYYNLSPSQWVQEGFLAHEFCTWAHVPDSHHWHHQGPEQILERLEIARTASMKVSSRDRPIFVLGLDAVDEAFRDGDRNVLRSLLLWFWKQEVQVQQPRATLIVTCRDSKELAERWLDLSSPYEDEPKPFHRLEVVIDTFSERELVSATRLHLPALAERFAQTYPTLEEHQPNIAHDALLIPWKSEVEAVSALLPKNPSLHEVDTEVFQALRHPALWHCLLKVDEAVQSHVLDGEVEALGHLATRFLSWFCYKARARGKRIQNEDIIEVLKVIAHRCDPHRSPRYQKKDWVTHASRTPYMNREQAGLFFEEALSAGLIVPDERGWWRWHHPFIGRYLALQPLSEEDE